MFNTSPVPQPVRVFIVDDQAMVRTSLRLCLLAFEDLQLVGEAASGEEALQLCPVLQPHVVLMDLRLPGMDGICATRAIRQRWPSIKVIALSFVNDKEMVKAVLEAGASSYLSKSVTVEQLVTTIREI